MVNQGDDRVSISEELRLKEAYLGISTTTLMSKNINITQPFRMMYYNSKYYDVDGDNYSFSTSFKMEEIEGVACPQMAIIIKGEHGYSVINTSNKGCESEISLRFSEVRYNGKTNDLTMLGTDIYEWQNISIKVNNKKAEIQLNDEPVFESIYNESIGSLKEITYMFNGSGMIDNVELRDSDGDVKYSDDFNR